MSSLVQEGKALKYQGFEKPRGYHGERSAKAQTRGAAGFKGLAAGLPMIPILVILHIFNLSSSRTSKKGFLSANGLPSEYHGHSLHILDHDTP